MCRPPVNNAEVGEVKTHTMRLKKRSQAFCDALNKHAFESMYKQCHLADVVGEGVGWRGRPQAAAVRVGVGRVAMEVRVVDFRLAVKPGLRHRLELGRGRQERGHIIGVHEGADAACGAVVGRFAR